MTDLKPCPFCGCGNVTTCMDAEQGQKWGYAGCDGCGARGSEVRTGYDAAHDAPWHDEAIAAWNTRSNEATIKAVVDLIAEEHGWTRTDLAQAAVAAALERAYDSLFRHPGFLHQISGQTFKAVKLEDAAEGLRTMIEPTGRAALDAVVAERTKELEAKLAKAVEALTDLVNDCEAAYPPSHGAMKYYAQRTLAELKSQGDGFASQKGEKHV